MSDQFAQQMMRIAVAQICSQHGEFEKSEGHAFNLLVDAVGKYVEKIGRLCRRYAEQALRTETELIDLIQVFEKGLAPHPVKWQKLESMCREVAWQIPATSGVPEFPVERRKRRRQYGDGGAGEAKKSKQEDNEHPAYVPKHFPSFPEKYTYSNTPISASENSGKKETILLRNLREKAQVQEALANLHKKTDTVQAPKFEDSSSTSTAHKVVSNGSGPTPFPLT